MIFFWFFLNFYQPKKHLDVNEFGVVTNLQFLSTAKTRIFFLSFTLFQSHASDSKNKCKQTNDVILARAEARFWIQLKQWLLAGKFSEFEYSPEIRHFWQIWVLAKMVFLKNWLDSLNSPSFANLVCSDSPDSPTFANLVSSDSPDSRKPSFASNRQIWRTCENVTRLNTFAWVIRHFCKFGASGHCLIQLFFFWIDLDAFSFCI